MVEVKKKATKTISKPVKTAVKTVAKTAKTASKRVEKEAVVKTEIGKTTEKVAAVSVSVYGIDGKSAGRMNLPSEIFAAKVNPTLMAQAVRIYLANQRVGTASTKTRSEVSGTTKKMYRQKGTGKARHGAAKAPIFVGGGVAFGPRPRDFEMSLPKKMKRRALFSALTSKLLENNVKILDAGQVSGKTKDMVKVFKNLDLAGKTGKTQKIMVVINTDGKMVARAARNITGTNVQNASNLTTYEVLNAGTVLFIKDSIETLKKTFLESSKIQSIR